MTEQFTIVMGFLDEFHGSAKVVGVDDLHARVLRLEPADLLLERLVVLLGEVVEPLEAVELIVGRRVVGPVSVQISRHAADGEVARDEDRLGAEMDHLLDAPAYAGDHVGHVLLGGVPAAFGVEEPEVVVVAPDLSQHDQGLT